MEAKAIYPFTASSPEELSFPQNCTLKVLHEESQDWYKAELNGREGFIPFNYIEYNRPIWFMAVSKEESVKILMVRNGPAFQHPDGAFLVRPSEQAPGNMSLSLRIGNDVQHFRILRSQRRDQYYLWNDGQKCTSINELVSYYRSSSVSRTETAMLRDLNFTKVYANYDFQPRTAEEMEIRRGEVITVLDRSDPDWWDGRLERDNAVHRGVFPANYVTQI